MFCAEVFVEIKMAQYLLGAGWQAMLCCVQHNFLEGRFSQQLRGDLPHLIEISDEVLYVIAGTSFLREIPRPVLAAIFYSTFEEDLRITRQENLNWIQLRHQLSSSTAASRFSSQDCTVEQMPLSEGHRFRQYTWSSLPLAVTHHG